MNEDASDLRFGLGLKLLVPILVISAFGLMVPLFDPRPKATPALQEEAGPRTPYAGELEALLQRDDLLPDQRAAAQALHQRLLEEQRNLGGIKARDAERVRALLQRPR